jgi:hypothetical protein
MPANRTAVTAADVLGRSLSAPAAAILLPPAARSSAAAAAAIPSADNKAVAYLRI